ncbi:hypothetical protein PHYC_02812 [Phycisphaerales bacterium]|nr:hypothetical protein PHYC_02812 [Phycisphaerales bacterium]
MAGTAFAKTLWALSAWCAGMGAFPAVAAQAQEQPARAVDFGNTRFDLVAMPGPVRFRANRVHDWREGATRRLTLEGDVRVTLGEREFLARRGAAWVRAYADAQGRTLEQVFVYLEEVGDPTAPSGGPGLEAGALPIRAVFVAPQAAEVKGDLVVHAAPESRRREEAALMPPAEAALAKSLRRARGEAAEEPAPPLPKFSPKTPGPRAVAPRPKPPARPGPRVVQTPKTVEPPAPTGPRLTPGPTPSPNPPTPPSPTPAPPPSQPVQPPSPPAPLLPSPAPPPAPDPSPAPVVEAPPPTPAQPAEPPIFGRAGSVTLAPGDVTLVSGEDESAVLVSNGVVMQYVEPARDRVLQLTARRAVVFMDPGRVQDLFNLDASRVRGIYLEGDVSASDGVYNVRAPSIYYDLRANRAVMLDAVFWTYDEVKQLPIYVRAKAVRQTSANSFTAEGARFTNSPFFDPELAIGASRVTVSKRERVVDPPGELAGEEPRTEAYTWVDARNITGRVMGLPVFYWPVYAGDPEQRLIKDIRVENRSGSGGALLTTLNLYPLLGLERPRNVSADILADLYFERGPALGVDADWSSGNQRGSIFAYTLPIDRGWDVMKAGTKFNHENDFRGVLTAEQRWRIDDRWTLMGEAAILSDVRVIDAFFEEQGETRREFTNRLAARRLDGNTYLNAEFSGRFEDFIANEYLLESQGYSVTRTPEVTYVRHADDLLSPGRPGMLTWFSEYRAGRLEMNFDEAFAREHGFTTNFLAQRALGINADQRLADTLRAGGLFEEALYRADTRQELAAHINAGPVVLNPFVVGRVTFWDNDFAAFSAGEDDNVRFWGAVGLRASTTFQRVYNDVDSRLLDIHRIRHIVEPNFTVWAAGTSVEREDVPIYDQDVEAVLDGAMIRVGVNQTIQTQRGGPGRWHQVNLLSLSTDFVSSNDDAGARGPIGRFFDFRPEYSNPGDFLVVDAVARVTDATSVTASGVYDLDAGEQAASSVGLLIRQSPTFLAALDLRYLNPQDTTYLTMALSHELTDKYTMSLAANYDTDKSEFQTVGILMQRRFSSLVLGLGVSTNEITGETGLSFVLRPYGVTGGVGVSNSDAGFNTRMGK